MSLLDRAAISAMKRVAAAAVALATVLAVPGPGAAAPTLHLDQAPATQTPDTANWKPQDLFLVGQDLWSAETDELVEKNFAPGYRPRWVAGRPDLLLYEGRLPPAWGFAGENTAVVPTGERAWFAPEMCFPPQPCAKTQIQPRTRGSGPFLSSDFRRVLYYQDGDLWTAEADWEGGDLVNRRQVTQIGVLGNPSIQQWPPILHWHANVVFIRADISTDRPVLKVDLATGDIEELPTAMLFEPDMFASPSGSRLCASQTELLVCRDLRTGETTRLRLPGGTGFRDAIPDLFGDRKPARPGADVPENTVWVDDETALSHATDHVMGEPRLLSRLVRADFAAGTAVILYSTEPGHRIDRLDVLVGRRHVGLQLSGNADATPVVRVSVEDGSAITLPPEVEPGGVWLDARTYLYPRQDGGLAGLGTWVHDVETGTTTRICAFAAFIFRYTTGTNVLAFPQFESVYFYSEAQGGGVVKADLAGGGCRQILSADKSRGTLQPVLGPPADLRIGTASNGFSLKTRHAP